MPLFPRRRSRRRLPFGCAFAGLIVFSLCALGLVVAVIVALVLSGSSSSGPDPFDPQPTSSTTAPTTGGWSSRG